MIALVKASLLESRSAVRLLQEVLAPIEQPLVDEGVIERVSAGFEARAAGSVGREQAEEPREQ
jgi:hypothetical protein